MKKIKTEKAFFYSISTRRPLLSKMRVFFLLTRIIPPPPLFPFQQRQARTKIKSGKRKRKQSRNVLKRLQKKMSITNGINRTTISQGGEERVNYISTQSKRGIEKERQNKSKYFLCLYGRRILLSLRCLLLVLTHIVILELLMKHGHL